MLHGVASDRWLPLTLTLSLREREQQPAEVCLEVFGWANSVSGMVERPGTKSPSPQGRGLG